MRRYLLIFCLIILSSICLAEYQTPEFFSGGPSEIIVENDGWTLKNDNVERRLQFSATGLRTLYIKKKPEMIIYSDEAVSEGSFYIDNIQYNLNSGWAMVSSEISNDGYNSILMITLRHLQRNYRVRITYEVPNGTRWWISKTIAFELNEPHLIADVVIDNTKLRNELLYEWYFQYPEVIVGCGGSYNGKAVGVFAFCEPRSKSYREIYTAGGGLLSFWNGSITADQLEVQAISGYITGQKKSAAFAIQVMVSEIWAIGNPWNVPVLYNSWYNQGWRITETDCMNDIPVVAELGCKIFVVDSGWHTNLAGVGIHGDWAYKPNSFPNGFASVANAVHANGMEFGFWFAPVQVEDSLIRQTYPEWAVVNSSGTIKNYNCIASDWGGCIENKIQNIINETNAKFLKIDFDLFDEECTVASHNHTPGKATIGQTKAWGQILERWRASSSGLIIDRTNISDDRMNMHDETWFGDWFIVQRDGSPDEYDPVLWKRNFDWNRFNARYGFYTQPGYTMSGMAPAHLVGVSSTSLLDYGFASIAAMMNLEVSGILYGISSYEKELTKKWVRFNEEMRPWIAYTQPISSVYNPFESKNYGKEPVDAYWHLRPILDGRYGYLVAFNPRPTAQVYTAEVNPKDYYINMDMNNLHFNGLNKKCAVSAAVNNDKITLTLNMPAVSWQIVDIVGPVTLSGELVTPYYSSCQFANRAVKLTLYPHSLYSDKIEITGFTDSQGKFSFVTGSFGAVDICIKVDNALSVKLYNVVLKDQPVNIGYIPVITQDINNDDIWDDFELNEINGNFGNNVVPGSGSDYNCDGIYDDFDYNTINGEFGRTGNCFNWQDYYL